MYQRRRYLRQGITLPKCPLRGLLAPGVTEVVLLLTRQRGKVMTTCYRLPRRVPARMKVPTFST